MAYRVELTAQEMENIVGGVVKVCDDGKVYKMVNNTVLGTVYYAPNPAAVNAWVTENSWRFRCDNDLLAAIVSEFELNAYSE